jgi:molecular chaperone GrpE
MYLRALADFDNYRRRVERERESAAAEGKKAVLLDLLEVVDGFEKVLEHLGEVPDSVSQGLRAVGRQISNLLERHKVTRVPSVGQPFNADIHEAADSVNTDKYPSGTVVDELQPGYRLGSELLRPARVRVAA